MSRRSSSPRKRSPTKQSAVAETSATQKIGNPKFQQSSILDNLQWFNDWMCYDLGPGPHLLPMHAIVNFNKGTMIVYLFALMCYFDNFSIGAWIYLALHGNYGLLWWFKDLVFPDAGFARPATFFSLCVPIPVLWAYYLVGYWMMSGTDNRNPSNERIYIAIHMYIFGVVFMLLTDVQKYLVLMHKRGLISFGMNAWSRNMNYVGEMLLYASFGVLCQRIEVWYIYGVIWSVIFFLRMLIKEYSLSKKAGWEEYSKKSWFYFPKLWSSAPLSFVIYGLAIAIGYFTYTNGGMEATAKLFLKK